MGGEKEEEKEGEKEENKFSLISMEQWLNFLDIQFHNLSCLNKLV